MSRKKNIGIFLIFIIIACGIITVFYYSRPGRPLQRLMPGCIGCHVRVTLELDGIAASRFSKGTHPINVAKIRPLKNIDKKYWKIFKKEDLTGQTCALCHDEVHARWQKSAHGRAFKNEIFQHAFHRDRVGWCLNCHAPLWQPDSMNAEAIADAPDMEAVYAQGITCVVCHLRDGMITSATDYKGKEDKLFHPVRYDPHFKSESFCAGCHQFNFTSEIQPLVVYEGDEHPMQNVVQEFRQTNGALYPDRCAGCHFDEGDHSLKSEGEYDLSRKLLLNLVSRKINSRLYHLKLQLEMPRLGHNFPTGDLFRILSFYAYDAEGQLLQQYDFRKEVRVVDREIVQDTTLKPRPDQKGARVALIFEVPAKPVRCKLVYRLQGTIDSEIEQDFSDRSVLYDILYDGDCENIK